MSKIMELVRNFYKEGTVCFRIQLEAEVSRVEAELAALKAEKAEREKQEPVAIARHEPNMHMVGPNDGGYYSIESITGERLPNGTPLYLAPGASHTALLQMLAQRARNFPSYPIGQHIPEVFAALGGTPPEPGAGSVPIDELGCAGYGNHVPGDSPCNVCGFMEREPKPTPERMVAPYISQTHFDRTFPEPKP